MNILKISLHRIDLDKTEIGEPSTINADSDFNDYVKSLVEDIYDSPRKKSYTFQSNTTEIAQQVLSLDQQNWDDVTQIIAQRLLRTEQSIQDKIKHMVTLRAGSLVQILMEWQGQRNFVITKVDHHGYLDEESLIKQYGLPESQRAQKTAVILYQDNGAIEQINLSDTNKKIAEYWWKDFLEVREIQSSERNTLLAFKAIDNVLKSQVHKQFKSDYWILRNAVIAYFRVNANCTIDNLVDTLFSHYQPDNSEFDIEKLKNKILKLPEQKNFDSQFEIAPEVIKARMVKKEIVLADNLELKITGEVDIERLITTGESNEGRKYVQIFSDTGYQEFNKTRG